jgi:DNA-binding winged helix-turn-helix (wHTH) protein
MHPVFPKHLRVSRSGVFSCCRIAASCSPIGRPVKLGGRAVDVLLALIEARGAVVSRNALMARVWPDRIVEENNLQWQISLVHFLVRFTSSTEQAQQIRRSAFHVRRDKAALSSGCKAHPAIAPAGSNRGRHGGDEMSEAPG